jgi:K+-sensing histidine kinase KdpD
VNRLVHNLISINGHNIQEVYDLLPQEILSTNWRNQIVNIEKELKFNPKKAALLFLRIAKNNIQMKSEFSIYRKLDREDTASLDIKEYPIKKVLLNVLHTFFADFSNNNIYVEVKDFFGKVKIDYETIQVVFYHLIENALKYARPNSNITIEFIQKKDDISVDFIMSSTHIYPNEREAIFQEGFSGKLAKIMEKNGDGIGMWRIRQIMELNNGMISVKCGDILEKYLGIDYSHNIFTLTFKK